jgi:hypothetical protein
MMDREPLELDDEALTRYFSRANEDLDADEFAADVLRRAQQRAQRRTRVRQAVLGAAIALALLIALQPMVATLQDFGRVLLAAADEWHEPKWYLDRAVVACAALAMAGWPFVARWLAR